MMIRRRPRVPHSEADETEGHSQRGSALVLAMIMVVILSGMAWALMVAATAQSKHSVRSTFRADALTLADNGLAKGIGKLLAAAEADDLDGTPDYTSGDWENVVGTKTAFENGTVVRAQTIDGSASLPITFKIISSATVGTGDKRVTRHIQVIYTIDRMNPNPMPGNGAGAVVGAQNFYTTGNTTIDGRDHYADGTLRTDGAAEHAPGFVITGTLSQNGSSDVGGGTEAPGGSPTEGNGIDSSTTFWDDESTLSTNQFRNDGYDNDNDGSIDETDGIDNDGDGTIDNNDVGETGDLGGYAGWGSDGYDNDGDRYADEDGFPRWFGGLFNMAAADGTGTSPSGYTTPNKDLMLAIVDTAKANGTWFKQETAGSGVARNDDGVTYDTWRATAEASDGGDVIVLESCEDDWVMDPFGLPNNYGGDPSLLIVVNRQYVEDDTPHTHMSDHDTTVGKLHGGKLSDGCAFVGVLVIDTLNKFNGNSTIIGSVTSFNESNLTKFANGTSDILFSSDVVGNLPGIVTGTEPVLPILRHWGEIPLLPSAADGW